MNERYFSYLKRVSTVSILFLFLGFPQIFAATFRNDSIYSKWIINSRMGDFRNKTTNCSFKTPTTTRSVSWDYVPGLVAKGILKAWEQYKNYSWSSYFFTGIQDYADNITMSLGQSNIDDLNAGKIYFELYRGAVAAGQTTKAATYKTNATTCRNTLKYKHNRIGGASFKSGSTTYATTVTNGIGKNGFWHKASYVDEMWLDGLYMGPALYAEWQGCFGSDSTTTKQNQAWDDIVLQFDTIFKHTWDDTKKLNYHAWSAKPSNDTYWANQTTGCSSEFWARGEGWFFGALMDVLEYIPATHAGRARLISYANKVAAGLAARQDAATGCWYQLLQYDASKVGTSCSQANYIESSASSMFTYCYFKGIRLGVLDRDTYLPVALKAYKGLVSNFVVEEGSPGTIKLIQSCTSAGLDNSSRKGDANYYLCGSDVGINNNTEGKVFGPFIMASVEYELQDNTTWSVTINGQTPAFDESTNTYTMTLPTYTEALTFPVAFHKQLLASTNYTTGVSYDFSTPMSLVVTSKSGVAKTYTLKVVTAPDTRKSFTSLKIGGEDPAFDSGTNTYTLTVPKGSSLVQTVDFTIPSTATANFVSGTTHDFTTPLPIIVTAQDGSTATYTLKLAQSVNTDVQHGSDTKSVWLEGKIIRNVRNLKIELYDTTGRLLKTDNRDMDLSKYAKGVYLVKIADLETIKVGL